MRQTDKVAALGGCLLLAAAFGCAAPGPACLVAAEKHVVLFPGITGTSFAVANLVRLIEREVPSTRARALDWTSLGKRRIWLGNLTDRTLNAARARLAADRLQAWRREDAEAKLFLVGYSGGVGMLLLMCDALPAEFDIEGIVLLSGAVSPDANLTRPLSQSRRGILAYNSRADTAILNLGTRLFGTMEGEHTAAAGYSGFGYSVAPHAAKLEQVSWSPRDVLLGNLGGHLGVLAPNYFRRRILPFFRNGSPKDQPIGLRMPDVRPPTQGASVS